MANVEITNVRKNYGNQSVIESANISIRDGEFVALVGASGSGKSTLLRMIAGLESITDGKIFIGERLINNLPAKDRDIAMVFQSYALYPHLSVAENMGFSLQIRGTAKDEIKKAIGEAAEILGLTPYLHRLPKQLSGGQRQRVAMGRAIVRKPQVFLFDEPLSNLDAQLRVQMRREVKSLQQRLGTTSIYVTHDQIEAMTMADRIVLLNHGHIEQVGVPLDLYDRPANLFVARFIGSPAMNLMEGSIVQQQGQTYVDIDDGIVIALGKDVPVESGTKVVCGIRPEHFNIAEGKSALSIDVSTIEATGAESHLHGTIGRHPATLILGGRNRITHGGSIPLTVAAEDIHLFDLKTGRRFDFAPGCRT
ncbi:MULTISPECIES: ABC transporter ATP-binding protein [Burkholderia]|uniref:Multiple sugar transport system ATP-binding protein n=1 Tax=Burkholderia pyrrocinia TaxID=60550 RepID=A0A318INZ1_BURPY|nr:MULTISPECIES: sn-glycerol-3-phosphate ABC transporter ATP-binding protein UgpC [Burkholderia]PXX37095.1 multiple sugar transport system ATP-binding protein [Burkholderia pyrrocinia]SFW49600.1 carbohydrate ABC transporter ATP-binding protein, CUT1 family (TC 3.A.1.1.-) [Burkholderia sp. NFACC33-1]SFX99162.1 carbohydrate ABC transporter ATP-binding protein, CUT1 family (TC 3.A.1.1.-) [Burkholderia sp. NFPP32]